MAVRFRTWQIYATTSVVIVFAGVTALASFLGVQTSLEHWQTDHGIEFDVFLADRLARFMPADGTADPAGIADYLTPYLDPTLYAMVFDREDRLIYWTWKGDRWYWRPGSDESESPQEAESRLAALIEGDLAVPGVTDTDPPNAVPLAAAFRQAGILEDVVSEGVRTGGFVGGSNGFTVNRTNRRLLEELARGALLGLAAAIVLSLATAGSFSRRVGRGIRAITRAMRRIAGGNRTESLPVYSIEELNEISRSALALQSRLSREEQLRRQWTMDVAHDLRTPIANIRAQAEAMSDGLLEASAQRLENLAANARRLAGLADNLLLLARMESPEYTLNLSEIPVRDLAESVERSFDARVAGASRELSVDATDAIIQADPDLVERALTNLIENALQHGHGPVRCTLSGHALVVRSGGSIDRDSLALVFDRLYRGAPERSGEGHGLGLSIVKAIADLHGWSATVDSADDEVVFSLTF
jgi:signal transduction histidine kinase